VEEEVCDEGRRIRSFKGSFSVFFFEVSDFLLFEKNQNTNQDLQSQLTSLKRFTNSSDMSTSSELRSLVTRATNAERRLNNAQNQLLATEEKMVAMNQKTAQADAKWDARVKEYEARLKAAEERVKRERQGSKERVVELEANVK